MKEQQEAEAAAAKVEADRANQPIPGTAVIRYNHYKKDVSITTSEANPAGGTVAIAALDEQFSFSLVFNGNFKINLRGPGRKGERLPYQGEAEITGMRDGEEYWCEVDEDAAADDAARRMERELMATNKARATGRVAPLRDGVGAAALAAAAAKPAKRNAQKEAWG